MHVGRYLLTVAIKSFGTDYLVMVLAPGIDNTGDPGSGDHIGHCSPTSLYLLHCMIGKLGRRSCSILGGGLHVFEE